MGIDIFKSLAYSLALIVIASVWVLKYRAARISGQVQEPLAPVDLLLLRHLLDEILQLLDDERFVVRERE